MVSEDTHYAYMITWSLLRSNETIENLKTIHKSDLYIPSKTDESNNIT